MIHPNGNPQQLAPYLQVLEMVPRAILLVDEAGRLVGLNALAEEQLGYQGDEAREKSIFEINPHCTLLQWKKTWKKLSNHDKITEETEFINAQGIIYPVCTESLLITAGTWKFCVIFIENLLDTNRYKDLLDLTASISKIGSWEWDLVQQNILLTNEVFELFEASPGEEFFSEEEFKTFLQQHMPEDQWQRILGKARNAITSGQGFESEFTLKLSNGKKKQLNLTAVPLILEESVSKLYGIVQDISAISARSEEMYMAQFTLENIKELIIWINEKGSIIYGNQSAQSVLGYTGRELKQKTVFELVPETRLGTWSKRWQELKREQNMSFETTMNTRTGGDLPVEIVHHYLKYDQAEFDCLIVRDLTKKKKRDDIIQLGYHTLSQSTDIIFWIRSDGSILYNNESACQRLGYTEEQLNQMTLFDINRELDPEEFKMYWDRMVKEKHLEAEHPIFTSSGEKIPVEASVSYVFYENQQCCCLIFKDVSERKKKEAELQRAFTEIQALKEKLEEEKTYLQTEVSNNYNFNNIISKSPHYHNILKQVAQVADTDSTVLIMGETGTGKELLARAIHGLSNRDDRTLVKVNCASLPKELIESELFGHEKGAFTGAYQRKIGKFELADQGTIFLDEIGEMPIELQAKLLRVLQEGEFERLGNPETHKVDVRVVAATNRKLEQMVQEGTFREDLFYRLNVFPIYNIPLRERKEDIPLLVQYFLKKYNDKAGKRISKVSQRSIDKLMEYEFPGNIRELENMIERAVILSNGDSLKLDNVISASKKRKAKKKKDFLPLEEAQKQHIIEALRRTHGRVTGPKGAAALLQINGKTLVSRMRKYGIDRHEYEKI